MGDWSGVVTALVGVVVGTGLTFVANWLFERARWKRDHGARWDERRLEAYLAYAEALITATRVTRRRAAARYAGQVATEPLDEPAADVEWASAEDRRAAQFEAVLVLGAARTIACARSWQNAVWNMHGHLQRAQSTIAEFNEDFQRAGDAREAWLVAARIDLSVGDSLHPRPDWDWKADLDRGMTS